MSTKTPISRTRKIVGYILLGLLAALLLYFAAVFIYRIATVSAARRMSAFSRFMAEFGILCLVALPVVDLTFGIFTWRRNRAARVSGIAVRELSCAVAAIFVSLFAAVVITGAIPTDRPVEKVIVLGLAIDGDDISPDLANRLDTAIEYRRQHPDVTLILTGGNSEDPYYAEASYMQRYMVAHGIPDDDRLIVETKARTTVENFIYSADYVDKTQPVGVVSSNIHLFRATAIARHQGYTDLVRIPAPSIPILYLENASWDSICSFFELLSGHMSL